MGNIELGGILLNPSLFSFSAFSPLCVGNGNGVKYMNGEEHQGNGVGAGKTRISKNEMPFPPFQ